MDNHLNGELSDGYHTFNDLYTHRRELFLALCRSLSATHTVWRSKFHHETHTEIYDGMFLIGINTEPSKQITYHFDLEYWDEADFAETLERAPKWDGHTAEEVLARIRLLSTKDVFLRTEVVSANVICKDKKYLLVQEKKPSAYGLWNLPAGRVEEGYSLEETAIKEAKEETGFDVRIVRKLGIFQKTTKEVVKHGVTKRRQLRAH